MEQHEVTHQGQVHQCQQCNMKANMAQNLKIHICLGHGEGWVARCGEKFKVATEIPQASEKM